jgi:ATP-binding cassette subfamily B (MDR/TAP) protein 1
MDVVLIVVACISAAASGAIFPLFSLVFGSALNTLNDPTQDIVAQINRLALYFLLIAIGASVLTFLQTFLIAYTTERQLRAMRAEYASKLLRLDFAWFDTHRAGECVTRLAEATVAITTGMEKLATTVQYAATLVCGFAIGFSSSWKLTLVIAAVSPLFALALGVLIATSVSSEQKERMAYARAGDIADEVFSLIRAVAAYGGERHEMNRYNKYLVNAQAAGIRKGVGLGCAVGCMLVVFYSMYGISTAVGAKFIKDSRDANPECIFKPALDGCFSGGNVITTFVAVLLGALSFGQIGPLIGNNASARTAAADLFGVIDTVPKVDVSRKEGRVAQASSKGGLRIEYRNVTFAYPSRPDSIVLRDFSLTVEPGQCVGLVGASGSGKSTLALLAMRAYDPQSGAVLVDGVDVKEWNLTSLRSQFGLVQQDPILFSVSIRENIAMGRSDGAVTDEEVVAAATAANAHAFIEKLPDGYNTLAGNSVSSSQLSGGQRQRVCIARAILRAPPVMLLDEATSALDTASERTVQAALDSVAMNGSRTMLVIAHRLSTLQNAVRPAPPQACRLYAHTQACTQAHTHMHKRLTPLACTCTRSGPRGAHTRQGASFSAEPDRGDARWRDH